MRTMLIPPSIKYTICSASINNTFVPNGCAVDLAGEGKRYDEHIAELGGIDLQLLGMTFISALTSLTNISLKAPML